MEAGLGLESERIGKNRKTIGKNWKESERIGKNRKELERIGKPRNGKNWKESENAVLTRNQELEKK